MKADLLALPFPDGHADRVVAIHVFEHFYLWDAVTFLAECKRVLKAGGKIVLELPCMDSVFAHICARMVKGQAPTPQFSWLAIWGSPNEGAHMAHKWGYFKSDMVNVLTEAGFTDIKHETPNYHFPVRDMRVTATKPTET